ncbi:ribonuclease P protein component [Saccharothrix yanglingensis]|uniref:Ribonuclease P protein component n=1 Tax=Saccharothrix yanglingensis TaxID=659496 RepID=A0ABU0WT97_9PSEU|nr:ribonuclease P protein component [Saccharothrix yanglingensis]MDQ2583070.1 ribonuclease P protein component [Saccharothrix yanglingensis]
MLPAANRLTRSQDFGLVVRRGRRAGRSRLVVHVLTAQPGGTPSGASTSAQPTLDASKVGFVVSKAVGNSVVRHRVSRKLRHLVRDRLPSLPPGTSLVVRALAPSADADSAELGHDLDAALRKVLR